MKYLFGCLHFLRHMYLQVVAYSLLSSSGYNSMEMDLNPTLPLVFSMKEGAISHLWDCHLSSLKKICFPFLKARDFLWERDLFWRRKEGIRAELEFGGGKWRLAEILSPYSSYNPSNIRDEVPSKSAENSKIWIKASMFQNLCISIVQQAIRSVD